MIYFIAFKNQGAEKKAIYTFFKLQSIASVGIEEAIKEPTNRESYKKSVTSGLPVYIKCTQDLNSVEREREREREREKERFSVLPSFLDIVNVFFSHAGLLSWARARRVRNRFETRESWYFVSHIDMFFLRHISPSLSLSLGLLRDKLLLFLLLEARTTVHYCIKPNLLIITSSVCIRSDSS